MKVNKIRVFSAPSWCRPCQQYHPIIEKAKELAKYSEVTFEIYDIDDEDSQDLVREYNIKSVPTTIAVDENNATLDRLVGVVGLTPLCDWIDNLNNGKES